MVTDPNDVDALIENLVDAFRKAVIKGVWVRVDGNGEMIVTHEGAERAHVSATGVIAEIDGEKVRSKPPLDAERFAPRCSCRMRAPEPWRL